MNALLRCLPLALLIGCGDTTSPSTTDAPSPADSAPALPVDALSMDALPMDAHAADAAPAPDISVADTSIVDASMADASMTDTSMADTSMADCVEDEVEERPCGRNDAGVETRRCTDGRWGLWEACIDPDVCINGTLEAIPCGDNEMGQAERACEAGQWGFPGPCVEPEPACDQTRCGNACVDLLSDPGHCGACDTACASGTTCCDGLCVPTLHGAAPPLATLGPCGALQYGTYANQGQDEPVHRLPDFSFAGYGSGGVALPSVAERARVMPGEGDDRLRIQAAIDAVSGLDPGPDGFRGAVVLGRGAYQVDGPITISTSGVVLRGEGQGRNGTVITTSLRAQHELVQLRGAGRGFGEAPDARTAITDARVPVGARRFAVADPGLFAVGDTVVILRTPNQAWIDALRMGQYGWTAASYAVGHERTVTAVDQTHLTVDIPTVDTMEAQYGGGVVYLARPAGRISKVGVEHLRLVSEHDGPTDEAHGWSGISLRRVVHGWVRGVTVEHFGYAAVVIAEESNFNTVEEVAMLDPVSQITGGRRYSFYVHDGLGNLFQRCYSRGGRHNFVTGSRVTGPNVWLDSIAINNHNDDGPHHRWATGLLFDNVSGEELAVQNRRDSGTGHGWAGAQVMFWNARADRIISDAPLGAMNWSVGTEGARRPGRWDANAPDGWEESPNAPVRPRSLYLQQLSDRLGQGAVEAVTVEAQRDGRIWRLLRAWAGEGALADAEVQQPVDPNAPDPECLRGIIAGDVCCAPGCGECGGPGCGGRPGGAESCCTRGVRESGRVCSEHPAPCRMEL